MVLVVKLTAVLNAEALAERQGEAQANSLRQSRKEVERANQKNDANRQTDENRRVSRQCSRSSGDFLFLDQGTLTH